MTELADRRIGFVNASVSHDHLGTRTKVSGGIVKHFFDRSGISHICGIGLDLTRFF